MLLFGLPDRLFMLILPALTSDYLSSPITVISSRYPSSEQDLFDLLGLEDREKLGYLSFAKTSRVLSLYSLNATELFAKSVFRLRFGDYEGLGIFVTVMGGIGLLYFLETGLALLIEIEASVFSIFGLGEEARFFFMA